MNVVYLSPHFPTNFKTFSVALKSAGARVLGLGDEPYERLHPVLKDALTEYYKVEDMHNYDELLRALGLFTHKYGKIDRLDSHNEYWLETEASLRDDFNIYGLRKKDMKYIRCKSEMKRIYKEAGLRVAEGQIVHSLEEAKDFVGKVGFPVVAKPDTGVGALDTHKVHDYEELEKIFTDNPSANYIMEEFITGQIYSFDGLADKNSDPVVHTSHVFNQGVMETVNKDENINYYSLREIPEELEEKGRKCLKAFQVKERFFHLEFFFTPNGEFIPLEVNIRPPGGLSLDMINYAFDLDIYQAWADLLVHDKNKIDYSRKYFCMYIGRKHNKPYKHSHREVLDTYGDYIVLHQEMPYVFRTALGDFCYIVRSKDFDIIKEITDFVQELE